MIEETLVELRKRQTELAYTTLAHPLPADGYNRACGRFQELAEIIEFIEGLLNDADERQRDL